MIRSGVLASGVLASGVLAALILAAPQLAAAQDPHAGHVMTPAAPTAPAPAAPMFKLTPAPPPATDHLADRLFDPAVMAAERARLRAEHGGMRLTYGRFEKLEARGSDSFAWEGEVLTGGDINRLALRSEGEGPFGGKLEAAEVQVLWSRAVSPYFDLRAGVRQDLQAGPRHTYATLGFAGLARYWIEVDGALFLSDQGDPSARFEAASDLRFTQRWVLEPRAELNLARGRDGGSKAELGLRLRYQVRPQLAPYLGVEYARALGRAGRDTRAVAGLRLAF